MNINWLILIISFFFSAFFSGMEIAFISSNKLKIEVDKKRGNFAAKILSGFIKHPSYFIGAMLIGNNIALVIYGIVVKRILDPWLITTFPQITNNDFEILIADTIISTIFILIIAEFTPKIIFKSNTNKILYFFTIPVVIIYYIFYPIILLFIFIAEIILKIIGLKIPKEQKHNFNVIDIDNYIQNSIPDHSTQEELSEELKIFQNVIDFKTVKLRECMIPRPEIIALDIKDQIDELIKKLIKSGHSKILIYKETTDNIIGYIDAYEMFKHPQKIKDIIMPILFFPESMSAKTALGTMLKEHKSIAVVIDEFGGTSGMVTTEDIIEEIFGEIDDEFDKDILTEEQISNKEYIFSGRLEIDYLNEKYGLNISENDEYETLAGFIISKNENIPHKGEIINIGNYSFTIIDVGQTKINKVKLKIN